LNGTALTNRHTPVSEVLAVNHNTFLVLERDGLGLGVGTNTRPSFKRVVLASTTGASNIAGGAFDLAPGSPGQANLPLGSAPAGVAPLARQDFVDLIDPAQLVKFNLNISTNQDQNTISEKWEALGLIPLQDPSRPDDFFLLVGNDNDFKASVVVHNGVAVGTNDVSVDNMLLAYRVTLPGYGTTLPSTTPPEVAWKLPATPAKVSVAGQLIGIVGATTVDLRQISSPGSIGINTNLPAAIQPVVDALQGPTPTSGAPATPIRPPPFPSRTEEASVTPLRVCSLPAAASRSSSRPRPIPALAKRTARSASSTSRTPTASTTASPS